MSCPHRETTTVAWIYGEGPEEHLHHVVGCADCQVVLQEHERVGSALAAVRPALKANKPSRRRRWVWATSALLAAAAALLIVHGSSPAPSGVAPEGSDWVGDDPFDDGTGAELDAVETEIDDVQSEIDGL